MQNFGTEMMRPTSRTAVSHQDGRPLRRYCTALEDRTALRLALQHSRAWLLRYEYHAENFRDFSISATLSSSCGLYEMAS